MNRTEADMTGGDADLFPILVAALERIAIAIELSNEMSERHQQESLAKSDADTELMFQKLQAPMAEWRDKMNQWCETESKAAREWREGMERQFEPRLPLMTKKERTH